MVRVKIAVGVTSITLASLSNHYGKPQWLYLQGKIGWSFEDRKLNRRVSAHVLKFQERMTQQIFAVR